MNATSDSREIFFANNTHYAVMESTPAIPMTGTPITPVGNCLKLPALLHAQSLNTIRKVTSIWISSQITFWFSMVQRPSG